MRRPRDNQRSKVYAWESAYHHWGEGPILSLKECGKLANKVCRHFRLAPVTIRDGRGCRRAYGNTRSVTLPRWSRQVAITLHETAHSIVLRTWGRYGAAAHGKEFLGIYMYLLAKFGGWDYSDMARRSNERGLLFISRNEVKELVKLLQRLAA